MKNIQLRRRGGIATAAVVIAGLLASPTAFADDGQASPTPSVTTTSGDAGTPTTPTSSTSSTSPSTATAPTSTPTTTAQPTASPTSPASSPAPGAATPKVLAAAAPTPAVIGPSSSSAVLKDLQVRLKIAGHWIYAITGIYWSAVDRSVLDFQRAQGLAQSGIVDQVTWDRLRALTASPVVMPRTASAVRIKDVQVRLKLVGRWPYAITGIYWSALDQSLRAFQLASNLPQSGVVDQRTWDRLRTLTATPVVIGRTATTAQLREVQLRLRAVGQWGYGITGVYWSALDRAVLAFQQQRNLPQSGVIDQRTWSLLVGVTHRAGTFDTYRFSAGLAPLMPTVGALDSRCRTGRVMCVDKATRTLTWVVDGKPSMVMWARFGGPGVETREGTFRVGRKYEYVVSNLYFTPMPFSMFFSGGQAVHYSSNFARLGYASSSHGCVNIADYAAVRTLFYKVRIGDKVVVHH